LSSMGHGALRETAYQKEMPYAGSLVNNAGYAGAAGEVTWLRLHHRIDPVDGEHEVRAGTSRDGTNWTWAAVLTLPADADLRIGIGAHGAGPDDEFTATFDYFRVYRG
ncbi:MAG: family 43 glycosylhydrolase, partial [Micromonosporaceae bacterium]